MNEEKSVNLPRLTRRDLIVGTVGGVSGGLLVAAGFLLGRSIKIPPSESKSGGVTSPVDTQDSPALTLENSPALRSMREEAGKRLVSPDSRQYEYPKVRGTRVGEVNVIALEDNKFYMSATFTKTGGGINPVGLPYRDTTDILWIGKEVNSIREVRFVEDGPRIMALTSKSNTPATKEQLEYWKRGGAADFLLTGFTKELSEPELQEAAEVLKNAPVDQILTQKAVLFLYLRWGTPPYGSEKGFSNQSLQ